MSYWVEENGKQFGNEPREKTKSAIETLAPQQIDRLVGFIKSSTMRINRAPKVFPFLYFLGLNPTTESDRHLLLGSINGVAILGESATVAIPTLAEIIWDEGDEWIAATYAMASIGDNNATKALIDLCEHTNPSIRRQVATQLARITLASKNGATSVKFATAAEQVEGLLANLDSHVESVRTASSEALIWFARTPAFDEIVTVEDLRDHDSPILQAALDDFGVR